jgi:hypothetical protein
MGTRGTDNHFGKRNGWNNIDMLYMWVPAHLTIEVNDNVDQQATKVMNQHCRDHTERQNPGPF